MNSESILQLVLSPLPTKIFGGGEVGKLFMNDLNRFVGETESY